MGISTTSPDSTVYSNELLFFHSHTRAPFCCPAACSLLGLCGQAFSQLVVVGLFSFLIWELLYNKEDSPSVFDISCKTSPCFVSCLQALFTVSGILPRRFFSHCSEIYQFSKMTSAFCILRYNKNQDYFLSLGSPPSLRGYLKKYFSQKKNFSHT